MNKELYLSKENISELRELLSNSTEDAFASKVVEYDLDVQFVKNWLSNNPDFEHGILDVTTAEETAEHLSNNDDDEVLITYKSVAGSYMETLSINGEQLLKIPAGRIGSWKHPLYGKVEFDQKDFDDIIQNFNTGKAGFPPYLRYGHSKHPNAVDAEESIGTIEDVVQEGQYLFTLVKPNSADLVDQIEDKKYRFASPELFRNFTDKDTGENIGSVLTANALTNAPFLPGLPENQVLSMDCLETEAFFVLNLSLGKTEESSDIAADESDASNSIDVIPSNQMENMENQNPAAVDAGAEADMELSNASVDPTATDSQESEPSASPEPTEQELAMAKGKKKMTSGKKMPPFMKKKDDEDDDDEENLTSGSTKKEMDEQLSNSSEAKDGAVAVAIDANALTNRIEDLSASVAKSQEQIEQLLEVNRQLSDTNKSLADRLQRTESQTQGLSQAARRAELSKKKSEMLSAGIYPVLVDKVFEMIESNPTQQINLSTGAQETLEGQLLSLLNDIPADMRVDYRQYSSAAEAQARPENPYKKHGIIPTQSENRA